MNLNISSDPVLWKDEYNVGIKTIDEQHKKFLEVLNKFRRVVNEGHTHEEISKVFFALVHYAEHYLLQEEINFKGYTGRNLNLRKEAHNHFFDRIIKFQEDFKAGKETVCFDMYKFLVSWFKNHILEYDKGVVEYLIGKGL